MDDDVIRDRLRGLADVQPPVTVDRVGVLRAGRRRRLARAAGAVGVVVVLAVGAYPAVAALAPDHEPVAPAVPSPNETVTPVPRALVDREAGTITMPMDELDLEPHDRAAGQNAHRHFMSRCMEDQGFSDLWEFDGPLPVQDSPSRKQPYGVWRSSDVRDEGYRPLLEHVAYAEDGRQLGDEEVDAIAECESALVDAGLGLDLDALDEVARAPGSLGWGSGLDTDEGRAIYSEWKRCLTESGVRPPELDHGWLPEDVLDAPLDEQVRIGLVDVTCKESLDLVQRMGDLDAAEQAADLARNGEYYAAQRAMELEALEKQRAYLEEHGITVP
ncbi:hypothetical protein [Actinotalea sp. C106]|uniref:hypothetical protein n=1 Tax=Actinotalea sp. C106 TaxID=2908644 RepID=UPI002028B5B8|nr:hypothetical protein [Actinotalea sp. C106]